MFAELFFTIWAVHGTMITEKLLAPSDSVSDLIFSAFLRFDMIWVKESKMVFQIFRKVCFTSSFLDGTFEKIIINNNSDFYFWL